MTDKQCKACKMSIDAEAKICPHCRTRQGLGLGKKIGIVFLVLIAIGAVSNALKGPAPADPLNTARYACREFLLKTLNDPDSAKLEEYRTWFAETKKDGSILVQPRGRAKNAFGAYIIGTWNCTVKNDGKDIRLLSMKQIRP